MSLVEENWQTTRPTIRERTKFVFNNDRFSDVKFVVRKMDGESESKQVILAHKFVLSISSPVFEAMFYAELAETRDSIELPDCEYDCLLELFRYMYSDEVKLNGSNVMGVLYLAKKYIVPSLAEECLEYLQKNLEATNVFSILPSAQKYEENDLVERCWKVIDEGADESVISEGFAAIERTLLEKVVIRDTLEINEINLFKAVDLWATKECERQGLEAKAGERRRVLGDKIIKAIRFPIMKLEDFTSIVLTSDILTKEEIVSLAKYLTSVSESPTGFPNKERFNYNREVHRCCRFHSPQYVWSYRTTPDAINFCANKDITLRGLRFFGKERGTYSVNFKLTCVSPYSDLMCLENVSFRPQALQSEKYSYYGFEMTFIKGVSLKKDTVYRLSALISGPPSARGENGVRSVQCSGVTFTFKDSSPPNNGTCVDRGQFPELLFSI